MVQMTMQVSEELAERLRPIGPWLPTVKVRTLVPSIRSRAISFRSPIRASKDGKSISSGMMH